MDLIEEVHLPSEGVIYKTQIEPDNRIRAPRLSDRGIGDLSRKNRIQADVLNKTLLNPLGMDAYDLHISDFTYLNLRQRMAAKGSEMDLTVRCGHCGFTENITVDLSELRINPAKTPFDLTYTMKTGEELELRFFTPRILDSIRTNIDKFKDQFPEATQDISLQETCRALIVSVNGETKTYSQMTSFLLNSYEVDLVAIIDKAAATNFGPVLTQRRKCSKCGQEIVYSVSPDNG